MSGWHVDAALAAAYVDRRLGPVPRASVEAHASKCSACQMLLGARSPGPSALDVDRLWARVEAAVVAPPVGLLGRVLIRLGLPMRDLVMLRVVASQSRQWTLATTLVLVVAAAAAVLGPVASAHAAFLIVAPLLPALGVAATYRLVPPGIDLLEQSTPTSPARRLLWRSTYVVATAVPVAGIVGAVVLRHPGAAASWLLPALACTLCVAVGSTWSDVGRPAVAVGLTWTAIVGLWMVRDTPWAIATAPTQALAALVSVAAAVVLARRLAPGPVAVAPLRV